MDRRDRFLAGLDVAGLVGIEIGALDRPLARRSDGAVLYVDHVDTPTLRQKYAADPGVDLDTLVEVDAVWGENTLREALQARAAGHPRRPMLVDYVIASHVVEHVPDLVGWLREIHEVLKPAGELRLAVPDRRFTFDCLREDARLSDVLAAHVTGARRPMPQAILDSQLNAAPGANFIQLWSADGSTSAPAPLFHWDHIIRLAQESVAGTYHDSHCWAVTPYSLADIFVALAEHGLLRLACAKFEDTPYADFEFYLRMVPCDDPGVVAESWRRVRQEARQTSPGSRFRPADVLAGVADPSAALLAAAGGNAVDSAGENLELAAQRALAHERLLLVQAMAERVRVAESLAAERLRLAERMEARALAGEAALGLVRRSTSWRLTQPLRAATEVFRRERPQVS